MNAEIRVIIEHAARLLDNAERCNVAYGKAQEALGKFFTAQRISERGECRSIGDYKNALEQYVGKTLVKSEMDKLNESDFNGISAPGYQPSPQAAVL